MRTPAHQIWGGVEPSSNEGSSDSATALVAQVSREADDSTSVRKKRLKNLPYDLQMHLRNVVFHEESSESHHASDSSSSMQAARQASAATKPGFGPPTAEDLAAAARGDKAARHPWSDEEDDHTAGSRSGSDEAAVRGTGPAQTPEDSSGEPEDPLMAAASTELQDDSVADSTMPQEGDPRWSKGSSLHADGKCKPCHYVHTKLGCLNGQECTFCHIPHSSKSRPRPCKTKRMQCKRILNMIETAATRDPQQFAEATKVLANQSPYLRSVLDQQPKIEGTPEFAATGGAASSEGALDGSSAPSSDSRDRTNSAGTGAIASLMNMLRSSSTASGGAGNGRPVKISGDASLRSPSEEIASI